MHQPGARGQQRKQPRIEKAACRIGQRQQAHEDVGARQKGRQLIGAGMACTPSTSCRERLHPAQSKPSATSCASTACPASPSEHADAPFTSGPQAAASHRPSCCWRRYCGMSRCRPSAACVTYSTCRARCRAPPCARQRARARGADVRAACGCAWGRRARRSSTPSSARAGPRGRIYAELRAIRDTVRRSHPRPLPADPAPRVGLQPRRALAGERLPRGARLVGTEGTCVTVLEATLRLVGWPRFRSLLVLGYPDVFSAGDHVPEVMRSSRSRSRGSTTASSRTCTRRGCTSATCATSWRAAASCWPSSGGDTPGGGRRAGARRRARASSAGPNPPSMKLYDDPDQERALWEVRKSGLGATARVPGEPDTWPGWEDSAVHPDNLGGYLATCARCSIATATGPRSTATSGRPACTAAWTST